MFPICQRQCLAWHGAFAWNRSEPGPLRFFNVSMQWLHLVGGKPDAEKGFFIRIENSFARSCRARGVRNANNAPTAIYRGARRMRGMPCRDSSRTRGRFWRSRSVHSIDLVALAQRLGPKACHRHPAPMRKLTFVSHRAVESRAFNAQECIRSWRISFMVSSRDSQLGCVGT